MELTPQQTELLDFVKDAHGTQVRKYTSEPYWHHVYAVAEILYHALEYPGLLIEVAFCHDLFEDTKITYPILQAKLISLNYSTVDRIFILRGVEALTDVMTSEVYPEVNRKGRKLWEARRLGAISGFYQTVKYADLIDNSASILQHDPNFAKVYMAEKRELIERMRLGNLDLLVQCYNIIKQNTI